ncbi:hypothetical protein ACH5RR_007447 [Cinchona calisaya]|uniref:Uncharacterized protein n=1 Tax=Cinchona calisaya TaxID=153742 RepID=A0ABD3ARU9_9GENT
MQKAKEAAANVAASAKSGTDKTKATLEEKGEKMTTRDPLKKEMAERKKDERYQEAELEKQDIRDRHAPGSGYTAPREDYPSRGTGTGTGTRGEVGSEYPGGTAAGVLDPDIAVRDRDVEDLDRGRDVDTAGIQEPRVGGGARTGYGAGSTY